MGTFGDSAESLSDDADKVEELKRRLIEGLKHATNIRHLKPDEWLIITVYHGQQVYDYADYI